MTHSLRDSVTQLRLELEDGERLPLFLDALRGNLTVAQVFSLRLCLPLRELERPTHNTRSDGKIYC